MENVKLVFGFEKDVENFGLLGKRGEGMASSQSMKMSLPIRSGHRGERTATVGFFIGFYEASHAMISHPFTTPPNNFNIANPITLQIFY